MNVWASHLRVIGVKLMGVFLFSFRRAEHMTQDFDKMGVLISHTGRIHWEPGGIFSTTCDMDITFFPFDIQKCSIVVGTWAYYRSVTI